MPPGEVKLSIAAAISKLDSGSYYERIEAQEVIAAGGENTITALLKAWDSGRFGAGARSHAVWLLAQKQGHPSLDRLFDIARNDSDSQVRIQAIRAIADLTDPVLVRHRLNARDADAETAERLAGLVDGRDGECLLEVVVALGRLRGRSLRNGCTGSSHCQIAETTPAKCGSRFWRHAAMQTLAAPETGQPFSSCSNCRTPIASARSPCGPSPTRPMPRLSTC